jgi:hypothetical protein
MGYIRSVGGSESESELLSQIESGNASGQVLEFAARGLVPLPPWELARAIATILSRTESSLVPLAEESFRELPADALKEAVLSQGVLPGQLDAIARRTQERAVLEPLIRHKAVPFETLAFLAERVEPYLQDVIVTNQVRLLAAPVIVEKLFENPHLSADIKRRADEFLEEFFLKKEREAGTLEEAPEEAPAPEPAATTPVEDAEKADDPTKSLFARIATMNVVQKIRLAWRGNKEERLFLIRDTNRLVSTAVLRSPKTREADVETIANMKSVSEDVLRAIALRKEWMRKYSIMSAIVRNPRSPIDATLPLVLRLNHGDQIKLAKDRNVPEALRASARREVARRER